MNVYGLFLLLVLGLLIVAAILLFLPGRRSQDSERTPADLPSPSAMYRDDVRYWLGGVVYYNRNDADLFIPKRSGLGWTVNFAHPGGKLILAFMLLLILVPVILLLFGVHLTPTGCHLSGCS